MNMVNPTLKFKFSSIYYCFLFVSGSALPHSMPASRATSPGPAVQRRLSFAPDHQSRPGTPSDPSAPQGFSDYSNSPVRKRRCSAPTGK